MVNTMNVMCLVISLYFLVSSMTKKKSAFITVLWTITTIMWLRIVFMQ